MKTSLQNTLEDIKSKEDKDSDIPASRRTRRKLHLDKFEKAQASTRRNLEDREWLDSPPVGSFFLKRPLGHKSDKPCLWKLE